MIYTTVTNNDGITMTAEQQYRYFYILNRAVNNSLTDEELAELKDLRMLYIATARQIQKNMLAQPRVSKTFERPVLIS